MLMVQDGVEVYCLPGGAYCSIDEEERSPVELEECPLGCEECSGDCYYYRED